MGQIVEESLRGSAPAKLESLAIANCSWISRGMPKAKDLDMVLEDFVVNDDRSLDQLSDIRTPRVFMSGLWMGPNHFNALANAAQERFASR